MRIICIIFHILDRTWKSRITSFALLYLNLSKMPYTSLTMQIAPEYLTDRKGGFASGVGTSINRTACDINRDIIT